jgi:GDP-L-fucose synthase
MDLNSKIYIAGHNGMVGSAIARCLKKMRFTNIITKSHSELDLTIQSDVGHYFSKEKPEYVFLAAAKVGGIGANIKFPADFLMENLQIQNNIIKAAFDNNIKKLMFLGSSCIYPREAPQPMPESCLLTGELEKTNEGYALAKIAGLKMCEYFNKQYGTDYISVMPTNLYGRNDNYHPENSHVLPSLIRRFHEAKINGKKEVTVWGTGNAMREFLHTDDLADACVYLMNNYSGNETINIGTGKEISIRELAELVKNTVGFEGDVVFDTTKPDGTMRKLLDITKIRSLGWTPKTRLKEGVEAVYKEYVKGNAK